MVDRQDTEHSRSGVDLVHDPIASDAIPPLAFEFSDERNALVRIHAQGAKSRLDAALQIGRQVPDDVGNIRRDVQPEPPATGGHAVGEE